MYKPILTQLGKAKIAAAIANNSLVSLTQMAVGDGNGESYMPTESQTSLVNETYRISLSSLYVNPTNPNLIEAVGIIPSLAGGFVIREVAIYDTDGDMIAISDFPAFEKIIAGAIATPVEIKFLMEVSNAEVVQLIIDESAVYLTVDSMKNFDFNLYFHGGL